MDEIKLLTLPSTVGAALCVLAGLYGNGEERVIKLTEAGYDYDKVQSCVNELLELCEKYD